MILQRSCPPAGSAERNRRNPSVYLEALTLVERLCIAACLDVIKDDFDRRDRGDRELRAGAGLLYNIGRQGAHRQRAAHTRLLSGLNVSINVKKLVEMGYLHHARSRSTAAPPHQPDPRQGVHRHRMAHLYESTP